GSELRQMMHREDQITDQLKVASGAFAELLEARFDEWQLTEAERAVAVLALKGFSVAEMAQLRDTAQGTIKAQCAALYRKADVSGRLQLLSLFLDDLMAETLVPAQP
ncbi:MAG: helix-turn-helix transcriptional regulator, partial [Tateyamaria sp.]